MITPKSSRSTRFVGVLSSKFQVPSFKFQVLSSQFSVEFLENNPDSLKIQNSKFRTQTSNLLTESTVASRKLVIGSGFSFGNWAEVDSPEPL
jgi:hypothetical protein